jgi:hypothetical protein
MLLDELRAACTELKLRARSQSKQVRQLGLGSRGEQCWCRTVGRCGNRSRALAVMPIKQHQCLHLLLLWDAWCTLQCS